MKRGNALEPLLLTSGYISHPAVAREVKTRISSKIKWNVPFPVAPIKESEITNRLPDRNVREGLVAVGVIGAKRAGGGGGGGVRG